MPNHLSWFYCGSKLVPPGTQTSLDWFKPISLFWVCYLDISPQENSFDWVFPVSYFRIFEILGSYLFYFQNIFSSFTFQNIYLFASI